MHPAAARTWNFRARWRSNDTMGRWPGCPARPRGVRWRMTTTAKERPGIPDPDQTPAGMPVGDERRLVARAQQGDRDAFDRLVEAHLKHVWAVVWRIVRHQEDAEDVVQEVFLSAFQALPRYRGESRLSTWLHRIAVTRALNHLDRSEERLRRRSHSLDGSMDEGGPHPDGRDGWPSGRTPSP